MSFKKVEKPNIEVSEEELDLTFTQQNANVYKYEVKMIVSLFAENELQALQQLDAQGGFIISRKVNLLEKTEIHSIKEDE